MNCLRFLIRYFCAATFLLTSTFCVVTSPVIAADKSNKQIASGRNADETKVDDSAATDSPGVQLAQQHLSELLPLLSHLRVHEPDQYEKAVRELDRAAKRLESQQRRGQEFYDVALRQWKSRGRVDLLKAKLRVRPSEQDRKRLLAEMRFLREVEVERLRLEWEVIAQRQKVLAARMAQAESAAKRAKEQMDELSQNIERLTAQQIDSDWPAYRRAAGLDRDIDAVKKSNKTTNAKPNPGVKTSDTDNGSSL